jgi:hypothetical protein
MSRSSGSVESTLCISRIAETPSTSAWWILVYIATRPSRRPSMTWPPTAAAPRRGGCCAGGSRARAARGPGRAWAGRCGGRGARCRTARPRSTPAGRRWRASGGVLEEQRPRSPRRRASPRTSRGRSCGPASSGFSNSCRPPTCIGMLRFSASRNATISGAPPARHAADGSAGRPARQGPAHDSRAGAPDRRRGVPPALTIPTAYADVCRELADAADLLADELRADQGEPEDGQESVGSADGADRGRAPHLPSCGRSHALSIEVVLAMLRGLVADLLELTGLSPLDATDALPAPRRDWLDDDLRHD